MTPIKTGAHSSDNLLGGLIMMDDPSSFSSVVISSHSFDMRTPPCGLRLDRPFYRPVRKGATPALKRDQWGRKGSVPT